MSSGIITYILAIIASFIIVNPCFAIYINSVVYDIPNDKDFTSRLVFNNTEKTNLYSLEIYKIARPKKIGEVVEMMSEREVLFTPLNISLSENRKDYFKFFYRGPRDDIERYYRVFFKEMPMMLFPFRDKIKKFNLLPVVSLSSILIVRPREMNFIYTIDESKHVIKNTGNTYFRVIISEGCNGDDDKSRQVYLLPGEVFEDLAINKNNKKFIVGPYGYVSIGDACRGIIGN